MTALQPNHKNERGLSVSTNHTFAGTGVVARRDPSRSFGRICRVLMIVAAAACATTAPPPTAPLMDFPSPLEGPGQNDLSRAETSHIERGWQALVAGDLSTTMNEAKRAGTAEEAVLLGLQAQVVQEASVAVVENLADLARRWDGSASTWITLSVAAERIGDEPTALAAARRGADLWPTGPFSSRARVLQTRWVDDRLELAEERFEAGDLESALEAPEQGVAARARFGPRPARKVPHSGRSRRSCPGGRVPRPSRRRARGTPDARPDRV